MQCGFSFVISLCEDISVGVSHETASPELDLTFRADSIGSSDKESIGDGVAAHHGLPGGILTGAVDVTFTWNPANRGGVEQQFSSLHGCQASSFGVPLIPADADADACIASREREKAEITGGEVEFFEVERVIGNVHFAVEASDAAIGIEDNSGVVIETVCAAFEQWYNNDNPVFFGNFLQGCRGRARDGFSQCESVVFFSLAGVLGVEDFLQADNLCTSSGGFPNSVDGALQVDVRLWHAGHLTEGGTNLWLAGHGIASRKSQQRNGEDLSL